MKERIEKDHRLSVCFAQDSDQQFNSEEMEQSVVNSTSLVVILTANCLQQVFFLIPFHF
jgi:hypothetical protein